MLWVIDEANEDEVVKL